MLITFNSGCGAILLGNIKVGDRAKIGAGTVVVKSIPSDCTVVGAHNKIINKDYHKISIDTT